MQLKREHKFQLKMDSRNYGKSKSILHKSGLLVVSNLLSRLEALSVGLTRAQDQSVLLEGEGALGPGVTLILFGTRAHVAGEPVSAAGHHGPTQAG